MFNGAIDTYLEARRVVEANFGVLDDDSEISLLMAFGSVLQSMWAEIKHLSWYRHEAVVTQVAGVFALPDEFAVVYQVTSTTPAPANVVTSYELHEMGCSAVDSCTTQVATLGFGQSGYVTLDPEPAALDVVKVCGQRLPDREFFTFDEEEFEEPGGGPECRTWSNIDIPRQFRNSFTLAVTGYMFFLCNDPARGIDFMNLANAEFMTALAATPDGQLGSNRRGRLFKMSSKRMLSAGCSCNVSENWLQTV